MMRTKCLVMNIKTADICGMGWRSAYESVHELIIYLKYLGKEGLWIEQK